MAVFCQAGRAEQPSVATSGKLRRLWQFSAKQAVLGSLRWQPAESLVVYGSRFLNARVPMRRSRRNFVSTSKDRSKESAVGSGSGVRETERDGGNGRSDRPFEKMWSEYAAAPASMGCGRTSASQPRAQSTTGIRRSRDHHVCAGNRREHGNFHGRERDSPRW
jgi:hypothetical protein